MILFYIIMESKLIRLIVQSTVASLIAGAILLTNCQRVNMTDDSPDPSYTQTNDLTIGYLGNTKNLYKTSRDYTKTWIK
jgi:hypothetical protein